MWVIFVEAAVALLLLIIIVWWTMFHGRSAGKPENSEQTVRARPSADEAKN